MRDIAHCLRNHRLSVAGAGWFGGRYCCGLRLGVVGSIHLLQNPLCLSPELLGSETSAGSFGESDINGGYSLVMASRFLGLLAAGPFPLSDFSVL